MTRAESIRVMCPLFHAGEGGSTPTSALQLRVEPIDMNHAAELNREWHSRLPLFTQAIPGLCGPCFAAEFEGVIYAVAIWSPPISPALPPRTCLELRRMAVAANAPRNTASRFLAIMTRIIRRTRHGVTLLVSYQDTDVHTGGIYRACGWQAVDTRKSNTIWEWSKRPRNAAQTTSPKVRWEKQL